MIQEEYERLLNSHLPYPPMAVRPAGELAFLFQHRGQLVDLGQEPYTFPLEDLTNLGNWDEERQGIDYVEVIKIQKESKDSNFSDDDWGIPHVFVSCSKMFSEQSGAVHLHFSWKIH